MFTFIDAPHLLKLIRNHFLDTGLIFNNTMLSPRTISDLLGLTTKSDLAIAFKLNEEHIYVKGAGRQKLKLAAQLFSNTTANAIRRCYSMGMEIYEATETADFIPLVNGWFDVLNSKLSTFAYPGKEPYRISYERQRDTLSRMTQAMSIPISLGYFQRGILMTNTALEMLFKCVEKYNMAYLITNWLNQDVLEHFFGAMRSKGGLNDHPSSQDFKYRLRKYILARNTEYLSGRGNVENEPTDWLSIGNEDNLDWSTLPNSGVISECPDINTQPEPREDLDESDLDDIGILQEDALEYIAGYMIRKLNLVEYECHQDSYTWVDQVSKGYLKKPKKQFVSKLKLLELIFYNVNGYNILHSRNLQKLLIERSQSIELPEDAKKFFFKSRIRFRIRNLNKRLKDQKAKQRIMGFKKMLKIKLQISPFF